MRPGIATMTAVQLRSRLGYRHGGRIVRPRDVVHQYFHPLVFLILAVRAQNVPCCWLAPFFGLLDDEERMPVFRLLAVVLALSADLCTGDQDGT
jgi:hypothetical protein